MTEKGTGSILAARRMSIPLVVVPNSTLLNNHQVELAEALAAQGQVVYGRLEWVCASLKAEWDCLIKFCSALPEAIREAERKSQEQAAWPAVDENTNTKGRRLKHVMDEEMGFVD